MESSRQPAQTTVVLVLACTAVPAPLAWGVAKTLLDVLALADWEAELQGPR